MPYAEPPVRYSPPAPWTASYGPAGRPAIAFGSVCTQPYTPAAMARQPTGTDTDTDTDTAVIIGTENCLFLNVWVPPSIAARKGGQAPVPGSARPPVANPTATAPGTPGAAGPGPQADAARDSGDGNGGALAGLPVMLFIHGGAFTFGAGSFYDGEFLAKERGAVVVTIK